MNYVCNLRFGISFLTHCLLKFFFFIRMISIFDLSILFLLVQLPLRSGMIVVRLILVFITFRLWLFF